ncbi:uncharacterized protein EI97DRAFT_97360 [Westerdykella ornata]|uniref:Uncharacterized protein n=1 Tax=Westerdykella ornata TaxID=318751 RepID=A0A6A6JEV8_WESOR|nr:uncharacterized protein EI97DRAFT_97360 [Westerdykella ornata]KAF2274713.1 hypothetical protein EI97DRAFT_97360 [Westerdykella ornata]
MHLLDRGWTRCQVSQKRKEQSSRLPEVHGLRLITAHSVFTTEFSRHRAPSGICRIDAMARPSARQPSGARTESQQQEELIQKLFKKPKRDNKELERLRETIERDQRELKDLLQEKLRQT